MFLCVAFFCCDLMRKNGGEDMAKVAFFFGAGAEGKDNFEISTGFDFMKKSLFSKKYLDGYTDALNQYFKNNNYFDERYSYEKSLLDAKKFLLKNFIINKSCTHEKFFNDNKDEIAIILTNDEINSICKVLNIKSDDYKHIKDDEKKKDIYDEFCKCLTDKKYHYNDIEHKTLKKLFSNGKDGKIDYNLNIGLAGILDSYFHTINDPKKYGPVRFSKIFNYYWACYFIILEDILNYLISNGKNEFEIYLDDKSNGVNGKKKLNYSNVLENIDNLTKELYGIDIDSIIPENCYYKLIKERLDSNNSSNAIECKGVITTNYFQFCEHVSKNVIYLNGQLKWFEYPEVLEVEGFSEDKVKSGKLFFPFIFGQSFVKPIVNSKQTDEFYRFKKLLDEIDILVILGFNINEDDNHINSFLHEYIKSGRQMIIVTNNGDFNTKEKLKIDIGEDCICLVDYNDGNENIVNAIFDKINENIGGQIDENNN